MKESRTFGCQKNALRGLQRLLCPHALPVIDPFCSVVYEGSISKKGDNADWDWYIYQDDNGEWVLFEVEGAGCIYNLTQHRYPSSPDVIFRFYTDGRSEPLLEIPHDMFGKIEPFSEPLSGAYYGPEDNGRGPIRVVRSFLPVMFSAGCKITSSLKLEGCDKQKGDGGWGHVTAHLYAEEKDSNALVCHDPGVDLTSVRSLNDVLSEPGEKTELAMSSDLSAVEEIILGPECEQQLFSTDTEGVISAIILDIDGFVPEFLHSVRLRMFWDGHGEPDVDAPLGTIFGNEYGSASADLKMYLLGCSFEYQGMARFYNYFPMPFHRSAKIEIYNTANIPCKISSVKIYHASVDVINYDFSNTGYFVSSPYYEPSPNTFGENSVIAEIFGTGHMVYGTISGYGIERGGCEGDVRIFIDGKKSPSVESDGSESWASYGWGFVTPPQCNPFSSYNGLPGVNSDWSEVRITAGDSYNFLDSIKFELEHGDINDGLGSHSGQIFCYVLPEKRKLMVHLADFVPSDSGFTGRMIRSAFPNGINDINAFEEVIYDHDDKVFGFIVRIKPDSVGLIIRRLSSRDKGRQAARVYVDGVLVVERCWLSLTENPYYSWYEDDFVIIDKYIAGKDVVRISIEPFNAGSGLNWNAASYRVFCIINKM